MKLLPKTTLALIFSAALATIALDVLIISFTRSGLQNSISQHQTESARQKMDKINRFLYERQNSILAISEDEEFESLLSGSNADDPQNSVKSLTKLQELSQNTGPWKNLNLVNSTGEVVLAVGGYQIGENIFQELAREINFEAVLQGDTYYSDVFIDRADQQPTMVFMAPVRDETNPQQPIVGAAVGHLDWLAVLEILRATQEGDVELFNSRGLEIGDNHAENVAEILTDDASDNVAVQRALAGASGSEIMEDLDEGQERSLTTFVPEKGFKTYQGNGWILLYETPVSIVFAETQKIALSVTLLITLVTIFTVPLVLLLFQVIIISPISKLTKATEEIAGGLWSKRVEVTSADEIGQLGASFNKMAEGLQEAYTYLENKVKRKTTELAQKSLEAQQAKSKNDAATDASLNEKPELS